MLRLTQLPRLLSPSRILRLRPSGLWQVSGGALFLGGVAWTATGHGALWRIIGMQHALDVVRGATGAAPALDL